VDTFTGAVLAWHDFYLLVGGAAATLVGLLFVAITLNIPRLRGAESRDAFRLAERSFGNFLILIVLSLGMLIPTPSSFGLGAWLVVIAIAALARTAASVLRDVKRKAWRGRRRVDAIGTALVPALTYASLLAGGLGVLHDDAAALYYLIGAVIGLLASATMVSWRILLLFRDEAPASAAGGEAAPPTAAGESAVE
jgi:modulator of FtsH protease